MSSLQQQLSRLSSETIVFTSTGARKNVPSLLYGDNARSISVETIHEIALAALTELQGIDPSFAAFRANIFHATAPQYDREAHTEDHNLAFIDKPMSLFLDQVIPYLHLPAAHRAIEFLIRRFRADIKCVEQLVTAFLPYHETLIFSYLITCLFNMNDPEKLPSSHILLLLGKDGWPGPRSVFLKQLRRNSYSLFAKLISKAIDLEKVSVESCLFYMRFCFAITYDLLGFPALGQDQVLLRETFRLMSWALGPKAHPECRDAACLLLLRASPALLRGLAESKQGRGVMKLFLLHPIGGDRRKTLKILLGLTHNALENNVPTVLTLTDMLYNLCRGNWVAEFKGTVFFDIIDAATKRKTDDKCRALLISFTYVFSDSLFRFTTLPWKSESVPDKDRHALMVAFKDGLQSITAALRAIVEGNKQKEKTLRAGLSRLIRHIAFLLAKYTFIDTDETSPRPELQELAHLAADIDVSSFASGAMQSVEGTATESNELGADVTNRVLTLLFGSSRDEYWMLAPVAASSGVPCILALDSSSTELRAMGYSQVQVLIERFAGQKPINANGLLKTLPPLCARLLLEGDTKLLETLCGCIVRLISALPQKLSVSLPSDELMALLSGAVFFYKRLISNGMLDDIYLSTLAQLRECLFHLAKGDIGQEYAYLGTHLNLLQCSGSPHVALSIGELMFPFGSMAGMLEAVTLSIKNASVSKHSNIIIARILQLDAAIQEDSRERTMLEAFISQVLGSPGHSHLFVDVLCQNIADCSATLLNTTIKHSTNPDVLTRIGTAYVADKDLSAWSIPLFSGSFDKMLASCILHNIFTDQAWISKALEYAQTTSSKKASKRPSAKASKRPSKRESTVIQSSGAEENSICDPDFLIACAFYVLDNKDEQNTELLGIVSQRLHHLDTKIDKTLYGPICKALQSALATSEFFDLPSSITELLTLITGSTRMCHVFIAQFISKALVCCIDQYEEGSNPVEMLTDIAMFINNASPESSATTMVIFGRALEKSVLRLLERFSYADRIAMMLLPGSSSSDPMVSTFCEQSSLSPEFLRTSVSDSRVTNPIKSSLISLAESCYVGMVSIADAIADKEISTNEIPLQQARLYAILAVLGTIPELVSVSHDISSLAFLLLGGCECSSIPEDQAAIYKALVDRHTEYLLPISFCVADELRRLAADYVSRAPLAVAYVNDYISAFPVEFLESLTRRKHLIDDPGALLSILIAQIAGDNVQINTENRREVLILRLVLRMMSFGASDKLVDSYQEKDVYGDLADKDRETVESDDDHKALMLLRSLEEFDQMSCIVPSQADAESLSGLCFYHPELLACAQTVTPDRFQTLFIDRMVNRLTSESCPLQLSPEKISQVIINLFQLSTKIYPDTPSFWITAVTLIKTSVDLTSKELISALDQQRIFLAILSLTERAHHSVYFLIFVLSNIHSNTNKGHVKKVTSKILQDQLIERFVTRLDMERQLQALYLLCHSAVWDFLKTGAHGQSLEDAINTLSETAICIVPDKRMLESSATMRSLGFSLLFDDLNSSLNFLNKNISEEESVKIALEDDPIGKGKADGERDDEAIACEDGFLSTLLIHVMCEVWGIKPGNGKDKHSKKKAHLNPSLADALKAVQVGIDTMIAYLDTYAFYVNSQAEQSIVRYAMSSIIGASILRVNDKERGSKLLEKLVANLNITSLSMACAKLYQNILDGINLQQPCMTLFQLLRQRISRALEGRRVDVEDARQAILTLYTVFVSVIAECVDKELKKLILDVLVEFCIGFPTVLDPTTAVTIVKAISSAEFYVSLPSLASGASDLLHSSLCALGHLVEACDSAIIPILKEIVPPLFGYLNTQVIGDELSKRMKSFDPSLYSETTLAVLTVLSSLMNSQGRFMTPYLPEVIIQLSVLCPLGPCTGEVFTVSHDSAPSRDIDVKHDVVRRVFKALLPELPEGSQHGVTDCALRIMTKAIAGLTAISRVVALRILLPAVQSVLDSYVMLVRKHALQHVEPLIHVLSLVLYPTLSDAVLTNELRVDIVKLVLSIIAIRSDNVCYALLFLQYDRLETCAIYLLAELDLRMPEKSLGSIIEQCWSWCMECTSNPLDGDISSAHIIKSNLSVFSSLFEKTYTEAVTSIQLSSPPSVPRMASYAHILAVLGGQDPQRLVTGVGKLMYEIIGTYLFAITGPLGCVSYSLDTKTIIQMIDTKPTGVEPSNAPMGMLTTCGLGSSSIIGEIKEDCFYEVYSVGRYFNLFLFACGHVIGVLRDDVYVAAISFMVAIVCSAVAHCNELKDTVYPCLRAALQAAEGSSNTPMLWEYLHDMSITLTKSSDDILRLRGIELLDMFLCVVLPHDTHWLARAAGVIDEALEDLHEGVSTAAQHLIRSIETVTGKLYKDLINIGV